MIIPIKRKALKERNNAMINSIAGMAIAMTAALSLIKGDAESTTRNLCMFSILLKPVYTKRNMNMREIVSRSIFCSLFGTSLSFNKYCTNILTAERNIKFRNKGM